MASIMNGSVIGKKKKMTWKECCNKWGRAAMEQQQGNKRSYTTEVSKDQLAANIFAYIPTTEWHKYYVARIGLSAEALKLKYAITFGEVYEFGSAFNRCPECDCAIDEHRCDDCNIRFKKSDDNIIKNMNEVARALGGWDNYYAATWKQYEAAKDDMLDIAPTAGMLEKKAKEAEKLLGKRATRSEIREVQQLWEEVEAAKEAEEEEETFFEHEAGLMSKAADETYEESFPQLSPIPSSEKEAKQTEEKSEQPTGFFFGEIPSNIPLPTIPVLEILPAAPILNLNGELNEILDAKEEVIEEPEVRTVAPQSEIHIQSGLKQYRLVGDRFVRTKKLPKTMYPWGGNKNETPGKTHHALVTRWVRKHMNEEAARKEKIWAAWENEAKAKLAKRVNLKVKWRRGMYRLVKKTRQDNKKQLAKQKKELQHKQLMNLPVQIVSTISIAGGPPPSQICEKVRTSGRIFSVPSMKKKKIMPRIKMTQSQQQQLTQALLKIAKKKQMQVEIIGKKATKGKYTKHKGSTYLCLHVKHMEGIRKPVDLIIHEQNLSIIRQAAQVTAWKKFHKTMEIGKGMSGFILNPERIRGAHGHAPKGIFVVRGAFRGVVYDARMKIGRSILPYMEQYSTTGTRFWDGFDEGFRSLIPSDRDHVCTSDIKVEDAGRIAALIHHIVLPMNRTTCGTCASNISDMSLTEWITHVKDYLVKHRAQLMANGSQYEHFKWLLEMFPKALIDESPNTKAFNEIQQIIGDRTDSPFLHVNEINRVLVKGGRASRDEYTQALENLLEIARYLKNRTENIKKGSLVSFRNKISQKAHVNLSLMCDNQLDKNGNLIWGERGYHSKRFFANYFEVVNPDEGYDKHIIRQNPNGSRKLAIGKLIVSTNFSVFREQMKGEPIPKLKLDKHCTSLRDGNFVYPCCCVTLDDGTPIESEFKLPTKNHLVIGNSGDPKYVDMPTEMDRKMYIAKEGYCYVNIFLAMLVNVNENEAKDFTKQVRDVLMEKLGKWPSMFDVATACAFISVFYPETRNAELPRILVDHTTKTMHVIDSFGSLSTGYHVLKANTVSQLIQFASTSLDSEMKHYLVGGMIGVNSFEEGSLKAIIKGIYKPKVFKNILEEDPYVLLLSILSPRILLAMYNSGSLDLALNNWITKDQEVATILGILIELSKKVTVARTLSEQMNVIEAHASYMVDNMWVNGKRTVANALSHQIIRNLAAKRETNRALIEQGHRVTAFAASHTLLEKIWDKHLEEQWAELTWLEKSSAITRSLRYGRCIRMHLPRIKLVDLNDRVRDSFTTLRTKSDNISSVCVNTCKNKFTSFYTTVISKCITCSLNAFKFLMPDILKFVNMLLVINLLLQITKTMKSMAQKNHKMKADLSGFLLDQEIDKINVIYSAMCKKNGEIPTEKEFLDQVEYLNPTLLGTARWLLYVADDEVKHQAKGVKEANYERIIAFIALILMVVDAERSDCVYKALNKLKGLMSTIGGGSVYHQSLDDISNEFEEKKLTIDFELQSDESHVNQECDATFDTWWKNQLARNNTIPHYRTEGHFMEFTRANAVSVANSISTGPYKDILIRGAVGSGKSTGLPFYLSRKGRVLLMEPTRPLAENVHKQLACEPFMIQATLRMRGLSVFGSAPITVMTSGYAFQYYAHNPDQLKDFDFIIFDECHVNDAQAMAFRCLLVEHEYPGKLLKVSATPPGREVEFSTQFPVKIKTEERLAFQAFVNAQGTESNSDVTSFADNILVYVASYNEVDELSKLLIEKGHKVTKVDGRTMKVGNVEIITSGTHNRKHFIVATNIIENGVTLDIEAVVDFGTKVTAYLDVDSRRIQTCKGPINYGERIQRLGRVGRNKAGIALRIGFTEKGLCEIPQTVATEAAFLSFAFGLPVMTNNVSTSLLSNCTVRQARTALQFELSPFYMVNMVRYDGSMHQAIHNILKQYKLRDSEVILNKLAIPNRGVTGWLTVTDYVRIGQRLDLDPDTRIPFLHNTMPERIHKEVWEAIQKFKHEAGFGRLSCLSACKVAFTLQTDMYAIPRTIKILDSLIEGEMRKKEHFRTITGRTSSSHNFTLNSIATMWRARYAQDYTSENIAILTAAKSQLLEFNNLSTDVAFNEMNETMLASYVRENGALNCVQHQSTEAMSKHLKLKGVWCKSLITQDVLVLAGVFIGGVWMILQNAKDSFEEVVQHQAKNKRQRQKLQFREARDRKTGFEVHADDGTIEHFFGEAYVKKGKQKGKTVGMGTKTRKFINMYGFDPTEYSFVRFVDPLTGKTIDDSPYTDILLVQEQFAKARRNAVNNDLLSNERIATAPGIEAYYINEITNAALKVDLTPHNPLKACDRVNTIAGFPEREGELRQTGLPVKMTVNDVPKGSEDDAIVSHESRSLFRGLRDYNPIASVVCQLINTSDGRTSDAFGIGYGCLIITNRHLFKRNNGELIIKSRHGEFHIKNTTQLSMAPCDERDILIIKMPKDVPPFPQRLRFRQPKENERICLVGSNFQDKSITSTVSETSVTCRVNNSHFWKHWIDTKDGHCGLPLVSTTDGNIIGIHSLSNMTNTQNFFAAFPENFEEKYIKSADNLEWVRKWSYNPDEVSWGNLELQRSQPTAPFKISKLISDISSVPVYSQSRSDLWVRDRLYGNLKAVGQCPAQLVTKHVVKGKCMLFELYLQTFPEENQYFKHLMGAYGKSRLNKEAYNKDLFKYASPIIVGEVDTEIFEQAELAVIKMMERKGFEECNFVTDTEEIIKSLNMKAAVGALYSGKKKEYFEGMDEQAKDNLLFQSCLRLYTGKLGLWNGSLKAELRAREKIEANKTRTFTAAPLDTLLGGKVCVDDFNNLFYNLHLKCPWTVGITKFYKGWDKLLRKLPEGWVYCDADGSQFDSSLSPYLINSVLNIRLHFMEKWETGRRMLKNLYTEIVYTPILTPDGTIVKKFKGNNSGQPSTVVDNTLMVVLAMTYALHKAGIECGKHDEMCVYFANGDDLLIAIEPSYEWVLDTLQSSFKELGLNYDFSTRCNNRSDLWFMSHQGIERDGVYIPKLEPERIVSILEWDRSHEPVHRLEAICAAMVEAWGYDELLGHIRKFYAWILDQAPYSELAHQGKAPYIAESALKALYTCVTPTNSELSEYANVLAQMYENSLNDYENIHVHHQSNEEIFDAGNTGNTGRGRGRGTVPPPPPPPGVPPTSGLPPAVQTGPLPPGAASKPPVIEEIIQPESPRAKALREARGKAPATVPESRGVDTSQIPSFTPGREQPITTTSQRTSTGIRDRDVNAGTMGTFTVPRLQITHSKKRAPMANGRIVVNLDHLTIYDPEQTNLSNTRATQEQFNAWYEGVKDDYGVNDEQMGILLNGLMVWCIENGTSPNINGMWVMMDGDEQVTYPIKPLLDHAVPTFRQIMTHFSDVAEAYIEKRNRIKAYMPRYGLQRNLTDMSLARYAFDFYELHSNTPVRAREAHMQMKAAALKNAQNRLFGLDGNVSTQEEDTERHTTTDVTRNIHNLLGMRGVQ
uniref:Genome polyprotein n=1 Tax=Sweet potato virus G TaxID=46619 RepID=A0A5Q0LQC6_9POTV|nr:polyprotein [Sweet potato virus G]